MFNEPGYRLPISCLEEAVLPLQKEVYNLYINWVSDIEYGKEGLGHPQLILDMFLALNLRQAPEKRKVRAFLSISSVLVHS